MTLLIKPEYYDFFARSMVPLEHYWPIKSNENCGDLKFAVEWGNNNTEKVSNNIVSTIWLINLVISNIDSS